MQNWQRLGLVVLLSWLFVTAGFASNVKPLPADEAFNFSYEFSPPATVIAKWKIAPGYYLYRDRFHFSSKPKAILSVKYPASTVKLDKATGRYEGYNGELSIPVTIKPDAAGLTLSVNYQGCAEQGFCYPPMKKEISLAAAPVLDKQDVAGSLTTLVKDQNKVSDVLTTQNHSMLLLLFLGMGLLLSFTPCVLPMIPILTSIIVGQKGAVSTAKAFFLSVSYVLGTAIAYSAAGVLAAVMGASLQVWLQKPVFMILGAVIFIVLALSLFGLFDIHLPGFLRSRIVTASNKQKGGAYVGVFIMGVLSALLLSPCVTAPLVGVLMYIGTTGDVLLGAGALFAIGIGMGIPLIVIGVSAGKWLPRRGWWMQAVEKCFGVLMLGMAVWLLSRSAIFPAGIIGRSNEVMPASQFVVVRNQQQLDSVLSSASSQRKPVLLDFYANWCDSCIAMEKEVFGKQRVQELLKHFVLVRADLSDNSTENQTMLMKYKVIAPPTLLLFSPDGRENDNLRIVGEVSANEFSLRMNQFIEENCGKTTVC